jgi:shikimate dehydrogenase
VNRPIGSRRAGVLGSPVAHSLSPALYRAGFAASGLTGWSFDAIECDADGLAGLLAELGPDWAGVAVTMPGKAAAAAVASQRSARVATLGVANTLVRLPDGGWRAENTDVDGILGALGDAVRSPGSGRSGGAGMAGGGSALVLGGGGTAMAVLGALAEAGWSAPVHLAGRTPESTATALGVGVRLGLDVDQVPLTPPAVAAAAAGASIGITTLPAGAADRFAVALAGVPVVLDVIYRPWPTAVAAARALGTITATGLDMLAHQAFAQFPLITGLPAPREAMRSALAAAAESG